MKRLHAEYKKKYIQIRNVNITEQRDMVLDFQILVNILATKYNNDYQFFEKE